MPLNRDQLRSGYTTGACAAAAAKAALIALIQQNAPADVTIALPNGQNVTFTLHTCSCTEESATASVIKDAGDDPDVTHGAEICATVRWNADEGIKIDGGIGVGRATKKGLPIALGEAAINPSPRKLIANTIEETLATHGLAARGVFVEIFVPQGEELAKKTFNPRLGIVGGISILGTTGIVVPYSTAAWLASITQEIDVAATQGQKELILTVGARSERLARERWPMPEEAFIQIGPFFGDALRHCAKAGIQKVTLAAMIGKLAKFAAGHESVHSSNSRQDFAFLATLAKAAGADQTLCELILRANTAEEVSLLVSERGLKDFYRLICERAWEFARTLSLGDLTLTIVSTGQGGDVLAQYQAKRP